MSQKNRDRIASAVRAAFETMETRQLLSSVQLTDGVLIIDADPHTASNIIVDLHASQGRIRGYVGGVQESFPAEQVSSVRVTGSDGDDTVFIDPALDLPTVIRTGAGDDKVRGGGGMDFVDLGAGDDYVTGHRGADRFDGGAGNDTLHGNVGDDTLDGGAGDDRLWGQDGDDTIYGGEGFDLIVGQDGDDEIHGGEGEDRLSGSSGQDTVYGGAGDDVIEGDSGSDEIVGGDGTDTIRAGNGKNKVTSAGANGRASAGAFPTDGNVPSPAPRPAPQPPPEGPVGERPEEPAPAPETPAPSGKAPRPVIRVVGDADRVVGAAVHVHGIESVLNGGDALAARYEWDFGDPSGRYNKLTGFNAAHVYDKAGVYTITLTVTNDTGASAKATLKVNVDAEERRTVYVDNRGSDKNDGSSPTKAVKTAARAFELAGDDTRILFKRGQKFTIDRALVINDDRVLVGAYGTGELPTLYRVEGPGPSMIRTTSDAEDVTIQDLAFDSEWDVEKNEEAPKIGTSAIYAGGTNITVRDVEFLNVNTGVNANQMPTGLLVMDTAATSNVGLRGYHVWGQGTDLVLLGNVSHNSTREHNFRTSGADRILVAYNDFGQEDRGAVDAKDSQKGCIEIHRGAYAYVTNNVVYGGVLRAGPHGGATEADDTETAWVVMENNRLDDVGIQLYAGAHHVMIRNNVIERHTSMRHGPAIGLMGPDEDHRLNGDVYILNNTVIERRASGTFLKLYGAQQADGITVKGNLWVNAGFRPGSNSNAAIYASEDNLRSFKEISGNVWATPKSAPKWAAGGVCYVGAAWGDADGYRTPEQWNKLPEVGQDYFTNDVSIKDVYRVKVQGVTVGADLKVA